LKKILFFLFLLLSAIVFAQQPKLMLPIGHAALIKSVQFSPDKKYIASDAGDNTVKVWETNTGKLLYSVEPFDEGFDNILFSEDGKKISCISGRGVIKVLDIKSGQLINTFDLGGIPDCSTITKMTDKLMLSYIHCYGFKKDDRLFNTVIDTIKIWNRTNGSFIRAVNTNQMRIEDACFSKDGEILLAALNDSTFKVWETLTGRLLFTKKDTLALKTISVSNNSKYILVTSKKGSLKVWETKTGKLITAFGDTLKAVGAYFSPDGKYIAVNRGTISFDSLYKFGRRNGGELSIIQDGKIKYSIPDIQPYWPSRISPNNSLLSVKTKSGISTFEINSGNFLSNFSGADGTFNFSLDSKQIISNDGHKIIYWRISDNQSLSCKGSSYYVKNIQSIDSANLFEIEYNSLSGYDNQIPVTSKWDIVKGKPAGGLTKSVEDMLNKLGYKLPGFEDLDSFARKQKNNYAYKTSKSKNNKYQLFILKDTSIWIGEVRTKKILRRIDFNSRVYEAYFIDSLGDYFFVKLNDDQGSHKVYKSSTGEITFQFLKNWFTVISTIYAVIAPAFLFSTNGKYIYISASYFADPSRIYDLLNNKLLRTNIDNGSSIITFSQDEKKVAFLNNDTLFLQTIDDSITINKYNFNSIDSAFNNPSFLSFIFFSDDSKKIILSYANGAILLMPIDGNLKDIKEFKGHKNYIIQTRFTKDGKYIVSASADQTCKVWDVEKNTCLYTFFKTDLDNYLVYDDKGRFDGTPAARKLLYFTCGTEVIELDQLKDQLWVPNLAERIMKGETINSKTLDELNICGLTPETETMEGAGNEYRFKITPRRGGLGETILFVNDIEAKRYTPATLKKIDTTYELLVNKEQLSNYFIAGQENKVSIKAYTADNAISSRGIVINEDQSKKIAAVPNLYAVMVGVSKYKGEELDLKYAAKDATDLSAVISNAAKKLLNNDGKEHVFMYNLTTANERYQLPEKNSIKKVLEEIGKKAMANDILLIFFAGHGVMEGDKKQFYFLTADASKASATDAIADVGISTNELSEWIKPQNIKAQKRILIFDACNSGQAINDFVNIGKSDQNYMAARNDDKSQQIKAIDKLNEKSGLFILSASSSNQSAYEMGRYSQGLLTYALLKAIKQQPDILEDGKFLNVSRWFNAAEKTVSDIAKENGQRQEPQVVTASNINVGIVDEEVMAKIVLPMEKVLFTASIFLNSDETISDDNLELSKQINLQLNDLSARGTESKIVYTTATNATDAYTLVGRYEVKGNIVTIKVSIKQNKEIKQRFELSGTKNKLNELAAAVVEKAAGMVK